jgi:hypothetical protein
MESFIKSIIISFVLFIEFPPGVAALSWTLSAFIISVILVFLGMV